MSANLQKMGGVKLVREMKRDAKSKKLFMVIAKAIQIKISTKWKKMTRDISTANDVII